MGIIPNEGGARQETQDSPLNLTFALFGGLGRFGTVTYKLPFSDNKKFVGLPLIGSAAGGGVYSAKKPLAWKHPRLSFTVCPS